MYDLRVIRSSLRVEENLDAMIVDNRCTYGMKKYTAHNIVDRMEDFCACYEFALHES